MFFFIKERAKGKKVKWMMMMIQMVNVGLTIATAPQNRKNKYLRTQNNIFHASTSLNGINKQVWQVQIHAM